MRLSNTHFRQAQPYWLDYLSYLSQLAGADFPGPHQLNSMPGNNLISGSGEPISFVPSTELDDDNYEQRIYSTGKVSTRPDNWHDLFNALVWMRFPSIKAALNRMHYEAHDGANPGTRGAQRDALTLFDESGVIVLSQHLESLEALAHRNWSAAFQTDVFRDQAQHMIFGHSILEKYLSPYKSMTAKALLVQVDETSMKQSREKLLGFIDRQLAGLLLSGEILRTPACLAPLPLAGIPGWWDQEQQGNGFYADQQVFRTAPEHMTVAPVIKL